ncbi:MAG: hypothetical protein ACYDEB_13940 [Dehalococcoidia bacterium]
MSHHPGEPDGLSLKRCIGTTLVAAFSVPPFWIGARAVQGAWTCRRGEDCVGPFAAFFVLGVPALLLGCGLVLAGVLLCVPARQRVPVAWMWAAASVVAVVLLSVVLWNK